MCKWLTWVTPAVGAETCVRPLGGQAGSGARLASWGPVALKCVARLLRWVKLKGSRDFCRGDATWWMTELRAERGKAATGREASVGGGASVGHGAMGSWSWLASLTGDREVRKAPSGTGGPAPVILFRAAFLRSFCRRTLSFPGLGSRGGGGPEGPWGHRPATMSIVAPWGAETQP